MGKEAVGRLFRFKISSFNLSTLPLEPTQHLAAQQVPRLPSRSITARFCLSSGDGCVTRERWASVSSPSRNMLAQRGFRCEEFASGGTFGRLRIAADYFSRKIQTAIERFLAEPRPKPPARPSGLTRRKPALALALALALAKRGKRGKRGPERGSRGGMQQRVGRIQ
jgi:hypothetical protein